MYGFTYTCEHIRYYLWWKIIYGQNNIIVLHKVKSGSVNIPVVSSWELVIYKLLEKTNVEFLIQVWL